MQKVVRKTRPRRTRDSYRSHGIYHILVVFGSGAIGTGLGFALRIVGIGGVYQFHVAALLPLVGFVAGLCFGIGIETVLDQARRQDYRRWRRTETEDGDSELPPLVVDAEPNPLSFRQRLAQFTNKKEYEVLEASENNKSSMPYWSAEEEFTKVPPRSASWIHVILMRIRRVLYDK